MAPTGPPRNLANELSNSIEDVRRQHAAFLRGQEAELAAVLRYIRHNGHLFTKAELAARLEGGFHRMAPEAPK